MLSAQFTATVTVGLRFISFTETRTSTGQDPVSESLSRTFCEGDSGYFMCERPNPLFVGELHAARRLALLAVSASGDGGHAMFQGDGVAEADSEWTVSPLVDGVADFNILGRMVPIESLLTASLFDLTAKCGDSSRIWTLWE